MSLNKNDIIKIEITDISYEGNGVGRYENMAVFVPMTAIGDIINAKIVKVLSSYAFGIIDSFIEKSSHRIENDCEVYSKCGGCCLRHISYQHELDIKSNYAYQALKRIGGIDINFDEIIPSPQQTEYRNKAQYPVGINEKGEVIIGFYANRSHRIIDCKCCRLQPIVFSKIIEIIKSFITSKKISVYNENTGKGIVRHIYIRQASATNEIMVCMVINSQTLPFADELAAMLTDKIAEIKSIVLNINQKNTNVILSSSFKTIYGNDYITDILCGVRINLSPLSFYQVNHNAAELLYNTAAKFAEIDNNDIVLDLYCGTGTIGLSMARQAKQIIGVEIIPDAIKDAKNNANINNIDNAEFICDDAYGAAQLLIKRNCMPSVVILDPPRKGCDYELINAVAKMLPEKIVYVSCNVATLARDCKIFSEFGYDVKKAQAVDMFPRTHHVECVVLMSRVEK